jgi:hypothetical protein
MQDEQRGNPLDNSSVSQNSRSNWEWLSFWPAAPLIREC